MPAPLTVILPNVEPTPPAQSIVTDCEMVNPLPLL
jgi:hypothetical protein